MIAIRRASAEDAVFLLEMLAVAADWRREVPRPATEVLADPRLVHYVTGWPRDGEAGFVAQDEGIPLGAAWWRTFSKLDPGFGFIDEFTPEVSIGVVRRVRRRGVGTELMQVLIQEAKRSALSTLSLSVEADNPAASRCRRLGFAEVSSGSGTITMALRLIS